MIITYMAAAIVGSVITVTLVGLYSLTLGVLVAPFGASLVAGTAALLVFAMRSLPASEPEAIPPGVVWC